MEEELKRLILLTLVAAILAAALSGCTVSDGGTPLTTDKPQNLDASGRTPTEPQQNAEEELAETVIYEGDDYKITATGLETDGFVQDSAGK